MTKIPNSKQYDLEDRTYRFVERCRNFVNKLPKTIINLEYAKQLIRSSGSQASNYIEANKSLSKKDFAYRIRICRKESKESYLWLRLCEVGDKPELVKEQKELIQETIELKKIFSSILNKSTSKEKSNFVGSPRGVYPAYCGTRRLICIQFWGQKRIGCFAFWGKKIF